MSRMRLLLLILSPLVLAACDSFDEAFEPADVETPEHTPRLVVDGYLFAGQAPSVRLYRTIPVWSGSVDENTARRARLEAAEVELRGNGQTVRMDEIEPGRYVGTEAVEPAVTYQLVARSAALGGKAEVRLPTGTPSPTLEGGYVGYEDAPVPGTSILERTHRFAWTVTLYSGERPRYYALFWKRENWDENPVARTTKLVRVLPGEPATMRTFDERAFALLLNPSAPDPFADTTLTRRVVAAEIDSVYYLRLLSDPSEYNANLPTNVEGGVGVLAGIVADSLSAEARTRSE